jgi:hypothetical protein
MTETVLIGIASAIHVVKKTYEGITELLYKKNSHENLYLTTIGSIVSPKSLSDIPPSVVMMRGISE